MAEHVHHVAGARAHQEETDAPLLVLKRMHDIGTAVLSPPMASLTSATSADISGLHGADWSMSITLNWAMEARTSPAALACPRLRFRMAAAHAVEA